MRASELLLYGLSALAVTVSAWLFAPAGLLAASLLMGWTSLALAIIDWKTFILPDPLNALLAFIALPVIWMTAREAWLEHLLGAVVAGLTLLAIELYYRHVRRIDALGRGDAKLAAALGLWLGWTRLPEFFLIAAGSGLLAVLIAAMLGRRRIETGTRLAFGPWIALSGWICWLAGPLLPALA